jgi:hypothetical protein
MFSRIAMYAGVLMVAYSR